VAQLEVLFLFLKNIETNWSVPQISKELRSSDASAAKQIILLVRSGFIKAVDDEHYVYSPNTEKLRDSIEKLYEVFQVKQVAVISFIYDKPTDKLKGFADAFKIRKD
jgi:predicted transcriptional regulator